MPFLPVPVGLPMRHRPLAHSLPLCECVCVIHMCTSVCGYSTCVWVPEEGTKGGESSHFPSPLLRQRLTAHSGLKRDKAVPVCV